MPPPNHTETLTPISKLKHAHMTRMSTMWATGSCETCQRGSKGLYQPLFSLVLRTQNTYWNDAYSIRAGVRVPFGGHNGEERRFPRTLCVHFGGE